MSGWTRGAALVALLPFCVLWIYSRPQLDDFVVAHSVEEFGFWGAQAHWYTNWIGRYASSFLVCLATTEPATGAVVSAAATLLLFAGAVWRLIHCGWIALDRWQATSGVAANDGPHRAPPQARDSLWLALLVTAIYLTRAPSVAQGFFWCSGALTYTSALSFALLLFASLLAHGRLQGTKRRVLNAIGCAALTVAAVGCNETVMALVDLSLLAVCGCLFYARSPRRAIWACMLGVAVVSSMFVYFAPGTSVRLGVMAERHQLWHAISHSLVHVVHRIGVWSLDPALWAASVLALPYMLSLASSWKRRWPRPALALGVWFTAHMATVFPAYWAMGDGPPHRAQNVAYAIFLVGWFFFWFVWTGSRGDNSRRRWLLAPARRRAAVAVFAVGLLLVGGWPRAVYDLAYAGPRYHRQHVAREEALARAARQGTRNAVVKPIQTRPGTICIGEDLHADPNHWTNWGLAAFHGLESVRLEGSPAPKMTSSRGKIRLH